MDSRAGLSLHHAALHHGDGAAQSHWAGAAERFSRAGADHLQPHCADRYWIPDGGATHAFTAPARRRHAGRETAGHALSAEELVFSEALVGAVAVCAYRGIL